MSEALEPGAGLALDANLVLAAGAGAGKTHALVTVALGLYAGAAGREPCEPSRVWAVTFTEKAARELRQRIFERAAALARDPLGGLDDEPELARLLAGRSVTGERWRTLVEQLPAAPIGTFHSLCAQLLRSCAVEAGLDPAFTVLDESASAELFETVLDDVLLRELEVAQDGGDSHTRAAARALGGPDLLRQALRRLHGKLGEEGRDPASLLVDGRGRPQPGFDDDALAGELAEACRELDAALGLLAASREDRLQPTLRALALERRRIGSCEPEAVTRWYPAMVRVAGQRRGSGSLPKRARRVWEPVAEAWERVQDAVAGRRELGLARRLVALLETVAGAYAAEKQRRRALDFVDLVRGAHDLLRDDLELRAQVKARIAALLVDEFQDTNGLQLDLVHRLAEARGGERAVPPDERASACLPLGAQRLAAVGDRKQSIYEFRGADVALFQRLAARARAGEAGLRLHALRRSWRSRPGLVECCNQLFAQLLVSDDPAGFAVDWLEEVDRLAPVRSDAPSQRGLPAVQLLRGQVIDDARARRAHEAGRLAEHVELLLAARPPLGRADASGQPRALRGCDLAILMRTHGHVARYRRALSERGIASVVVGGRGFYAAREVRELAALMLAIADPRDPLAAAALWRSPIWGIADASLVELAAADRLRLHDHRSGCCVELPERDAAAVTALARLVLGLHRELERLGPARVLGHAIERLGLREVLAWDDAGEQRVANVDKLLELLAGPAFAGLGAAALARRMLARADDLLDREAPAEVTAAADPNAVRIMTVHAAKGLEFPVVVVPELGAEPRGQEGPVVFERELGLAVVSPDLVGRRRVSPHARTVHERLAARRDAESRRLLYVAATRARDLLVLIGEAPERGAGEGNWRRLLDAALPELEGAAAAALEIVEAPGDHERPSDGDDNPGPMQWLLARVAEVREAAVAAGDLPAEASGEPGEGTGFARLEAQVAEVDKAAAAAPSPPPDSAEAFAAAYARSEALELRDCELELSLTGLAEFAACPRRYLLTHVVGLASPPAAPGEPAAAPRGLSLLPFAPRRRAHEDDPGDGGPTTLAEARARGRLVHHLLARVDLASFADEPVRALEAVARRDARLESDWRELEPDLLRLSARPWLAEVIAAQRDDPRRVLRSLPIALSLLGASAEEARPAAGQAQLDLFAPPPTQRRAATARGRVIVRGRIDLLWIDDAGGLNLVDWQYARAPAKAASVLDPHTVPGLRRLAQATALRRLWGPEAPLRAGAVFLREAEPDPGLVELGPAQRSAAERRLAATAARLLSSELGQIEGEAWPKLEHPSRCGSCVHRARCWTSPDPHRESEPPVEHQVETQAEPNAS